MIIGAKGVFSIVILIIQITKKWFSSISKIKEKPLLAYYTKKERDQKYGIVVAEITIPLIVMLYVLNICHIIILNGGITNINMHCHSAIITSPFVRIARFFCYFLA